MMKMMIAPNTQIPIANGAMVIITPVGMMPLRVFVKATLWLLSVSGTAPELSPETASAPSRLWVAV